MKSDVSAAVLLIGDEILSGRTQDANLKQIAEFLQPLGVPVKEARVVTDGQPAIVEAVRALSAAHDYVFTTGGIGPTHDDITADGMAVAFGREIGVREDARQILEEWYARSGTQITDARLRMARIPAGASLIANPVTGAPGFQIENVFVMAGVPKITRGMLEDVAHRIEGGPVTHTVSVRLEDVREGDIAQALGALAQEHTEISFGSYPWFEDVGGALRRGVVLVARGRDQAFLDYLRGQLEALG